MFDLKKKKLDKRVITENLHREFYVNLDTGTLLEFTNHCYVTEPGAIIEYKEIA